MFADIINFTRLSEEMPPKFMVTMLNEVFSHFDELAEKHGLEKIKTIGDAYMVAGGLDIHTCTPMTWGPSATTARRCAPSRSTWWITWPRGHTCPRSPES